MCPGEEAYTLAMVLAEALGMEAFRQRVKIYATDMDEEALTQARHASYSTEALPPVPAALREKYFETSGDRGVFPTCAAQSSLGATISSRMPPSRVWTSWCVAIP